MLVSFDTISFINFIVKQNIIIRVTLLPDCLGITPTRIFCIVTGLFGRFFLGSDECFFRSLGFSSFRSFGPVGGHPGAQALQRPAGPAHKAFGRSIFFLFNRFKTACVVFIVKQNVDIVFVIERTERISFFGLRLRIGFVL